MSLNDVNKFLPVHSTILDQNGRNSVQTSILYWRAYMKFYLHLLHFYQTWINFSTGHVNKNWLFHKNQPIKCHTSCRDKLTSVHTFHTYCPIWDTHSTSCMNITLFSIGYFHKSGAWKAALFIWSKMKWNLCNMKRYDILKLKNALVKSVCYVKKYTTYNLVFNWSIQ